MPGSECRGVKQISNHFGVLALGERTVIEGLRGGKPTLTEIADFVLPRAVSRGIAQSSLGVLGAVLEQARELAYELECYRLRDRDDPIAKACRRNLRSAIFQRGRRMCAT